MKKRFFISIVILFIVITSVSLIYEKKSNRPTGKPSLGIWLSYYEADFNTNSEKEFEISVDTLYNKLVENNIDTLYLHVRANCDAIYDSDIFTYSEYYLDENGNEPAFDPLKIITSRAKEFNISVHAWINPYRVSNTVKKIENLETGHAAKEIFIEDEYSVIEWDSGIYLNPASKVAQRLILDGIRELTKYELNGIHFDDYFYPTTSEKFDEVSFSEYKNSGGTLSLADWRRANVNSLISSVYQIVNLNKMTFGISPMADIETNYDSYYADIEKWVLEDGYIDYIAPQIYYGFNHPYKPFRETVDEWVDLAKRGDKEIFIGLAGYKQGKEDEYIIEKFEEEGREWIKNKKLLSQEAKTVFDDSYATGVIIFSYKKYFDDVNNINRQEINNTLT